MRDLLRHASSVGGAGRVLSSALATIVLVASLLPLGIAPDSPTPGGDPTPPAALLERDDLSHVAATTPLSEADAAGDVTTDEADPDGPSFSEAHGDAAGSARMPARESRAAAAGVVGFTPGDIISDAVFANRSAMTLTQVSDFIESKVGACQTGYTCLEDYSETTTTRAADGYCSQYTGASRESAARIIYNVSQACGINPQVLLVMLQKEQGLVTHDWPSEFRFTKAMGMGCPDNAECDKKLQGFFNQVYGAARQMRVYAKDTAYFSWYAPGATHDILYNPDEACGTAPVLIKNQATANLYYYTPYQPNAAALAAGAGEGDSCSSYGNRNFYTVFRAWFETTGGGTAAPTFTAGTPTVIGTAAVGRTLTAFPGDWTWRTAFTYQWLRDGAAISGATASTYTPKAADLARGISVRISGTRSGYAAVTKPSTAKTVATGTVTTATPTISGTVAVDKTITAVPGAWTSGTAFSYQWLRDGKAIAGATARTFALKPADHGRKFSVKVTGRQTGYASAAKTSASKTVTLGTLAAKTPVIAGTAKTGQLLTAKTGTWTTGTKFSYQWLRDGRAISGASGSTYRLTASDVGRKLSVKVTGKLTGYANAAKTSSTVTGAAGTLVTATPTIAGTAKVGQKLTAKPGAWTSGTTLFYQWLRDGKAIAGASGTTYALKSADGGRKIAVKVTGKKPGYTTAAKTSASRTIAK
ncbi:hypothetical protein [Microbacterium rhizophilus]|uniref:hypothetical protein n=1 Tax=Microbacterium rhizophilus TaxID=3138934 RepID=UPI0031E51263